MSNFLWGFDMHARNISDNMEHARRTEGLGPLTNGFAMLYGNKTPLSRWWFSIFIDTNQIETRLRMIWAQLVVAEDASPAASPDDSRASMVQAWYRAGLRRLPNWAAAPACCPPQAAHLRDSLKIAVAGGRFSSSPCINRRLRYRSGISGVAVS